MSVSPFFYLERLNRKTHKYEEYAPLVTDEDGKVVLADLFPNDADHELFSIIQDDSSFSELPPMKGIHHGLPFDVSKTILTSYQECCDDSTGLRPSVYNFTYADMMVYCLQNPQCVDTENSNMMNISYEVNPIINLMSRVEAFCEVIDPWGWEDDCSYIRVVCWFL